LLITVKHSSIDYSNEISIIVSLSLSLLIFTPNTRNLSLNDGVVDIIMLITAISPPTDIADYTFPQALSIVVDVVVWPSPRWLWFHPVTVQITLNYSLVRMIC
jgi:hypothetical protein